MKYRNICFFSDDFIPAKTGTGISVAMMAKELVCRGHNVIVLTTRQPGQPRQEIIDGIKIYRFFSLPLFGFYQAIATKGQIRKILQQHEVELAHFHYLSLLSVLGSQVAKELAIKKIFTHHMTVDHLTQPWLLKPLRPLFELQIKRFCEGMDMATAPSLNFVQQNSAKSPVPLTFLSNPMPYKFEFQVGQTEANLHKEFTFLYAGRLDEEKNVSFLIRGFALALKQDPNIKLCIAGKGRELSKLRQLTKKLNVEDKVIFMGWLERRALAEIYKESDAFILPSRIETQAIVVLEAMTFGLPIIMADSIITATEFINEGENGLIVKSNNDKSLAEAICKLSENPHLSKKMGEASRSRVTSAHVTLENVVDKLEALYAAQ